jgi:branched-chain amino acid transport system ATP-binding protein
LLRLSQISKRFSGLEVLRDVAFEVSEGEVVGLIGPNGAGKTTLFNIISGSLKPNQGTVFFAGREITGMPPYRVSKLGIARTFQIPQPFSQMTVLQNVRAAALFSNPGRRGKLPKDGVKLCEMTGLGGKTNQAAGSLTSSEKKRLEVARALSTSPRLLLLDEFAVGLTVAEATWASDVVKELSREYGITIVWTEHVMRVLMRSVERVLVLQQGELIAQGTPAEIVKNERVLSAYFGGKAT